MWSFGQPPPSLGTDRGTSNISSDLYRLQERAAEIRSRLLIGFDRDLFLELVDTDTRIESIQVATEIPLEFESECLKGLEGVYFDEHVRGAYSFYYTGDVQSMVRRIKGDPRFRDVQVKVALHEAGQAAPITVSWSTLRPTSHRNIRIDSVPAVNDAEDLGDIRVTSITQPVRSQVRGLLSTLPRGEAANDPTYAELQSGVVHHPFAQTRWGRDQVSATQGEIIYFPRASVIPESDSDDGIPLLWEDQLIEAGPRYRAYEASDIAPGAISEQVYPYIPRFDTLLSSSKAPSRSIRERIASRISMIGKKIASWFRWAA